MKAVLCSGSRTALAVRIEAKLGESLVTPNIRACAKTIVTAITAGAHKHEIHNSPKKRDEKY